MLSKKVRFCCVLDLDPRFLVELVLWIVCLRYIYPKNNITVYTIGDLSVDFLSFLTENNINVKKGNIPIKESLHCNKILPLYDNFDEEFIVISDIDVFFIRDISEYLRKGRIRAAQNFHCIPPRQIFLQVLAASGLARSYRPGLALFKGEAGLRETHINNINGGLIIVPQEKRMPFAHLWKKWAVWLVENRSLLGRWAINVDQVAFALAMEEAGEDVDFLPPQLNAPLHLLPEIAEVYALHLSSGHIPSFPFMFNDDKTLNGNNLYEEIKRDIFLINQRIKESCKIITSLPSTKGHIDKFINPDWIR